jgi:hypothetical protein
MVQFLEKRGVKQLEFACLTHPHEDHYVGLKDILEFARPKCFVKPSVMAPDGLRRIITAQMAAIVSAPLVDPNRQRSVKSLGELFGWLDAQNINYATVSLDTKVYPFNLTQPQSVTVTAVSPCGNEMHNYETELGKCFDENGKLKAKIPADIDHNAISIALLIESPNFSLVLGGDVCNANWAATDNRFKFASRLVKVSHHGSKTSYSEELWKRFALPGANTIAVLTGYKSKLPEPEVLKGIAKYSQAIYCTNLDYLPPTMRPPSKPNFFEQDPKLRALKDLAPMGDTVQYGRCSFYFNELGGIDSIDCTSTACRVNPELQPNAD